MDRGENDNDCHYHDGSFALVLMVELWRNGEILVILSSQDWYGRYQE